MKVSICKEVISRAAVVPSFNKAGDWSKEDLVIGRLIRSNVPSFNCGLDAVDKGDTIILSHEKVLTTEDVATLAAIVAEYDSEGKYKYIRVVSLVRPTLESSLEVA